MEYVYAGLVVLILLGLVLTWGAVKGGLAMTDYVDD